MTTLSIDIRRAELRDAASIAEVYCEAWRVAYSGIIPHRALNGMIGRRREDWWATAIRRSVSVLVVEIAGTIAGYVTMGCNRARELRQEGEVYELYLRPEYQGVGLGTRLFSEARQLLSGNGLDGLVVWVLEDNINAMRFYAGLGGRAIAESVEIFDRKALRKVAFAWD